MIPLLALLLSCQEPQEDEPEPLREPGAAARMQAVDVYARYNLSHPYHLDRRTVAGLSIGAMDVIHAGLLDGGDDPPAARLLKWAFSGGVSVAVTHVAHEYGHLSSLSKAGRHLDYVVAFPDDPGEEREDLTPGRLLAQGLGFAPRRSVGVAEDDWDSVRRLFAGDPRGFNRYLLAAEAGGMNQEQVLACAYGDRLRDGRMSYLDTPAWLWAASGTLLYPASRDEGDLSRYEDLLEADGHSASTASIKAFSMVRFLGGTGVAAMRGAVLGFTGEDGGFVPPAAWDVGEDVRVYWPEFESWLTREGPTVRAALPVRWASWSWEPAYERSFAGGGVGHEAGARIRWSAAEFVAVQGSVSLSDAGGRWLELEAELRPAPWASLLLGVEGGRGYTFQREIFGSLSDVLEDSERSVLLGLRLSATF